MSAAGRARRALPWLLVPLLALLAVYLPPSLSAGWVVDDWGQLANHQHPGDWRGEWTTSTHAHAIGEESYVWRPLPFSVYHLWGAVFGRTPTAYRVLNVLAALGVAVLAFLAARRAGATARGAGLATLVLVLHPLTPEVVAWNATLNDLFAAAFLLGSLALALRSGPGLGGRAVATGLLFLGALLSKEASLAWLAALPAAVLLLRGLRGAVAHGVALLAAVLVHGRWKATVVSDAVMFDPVDTVRTHGPELLAVYTDYLRWPVTRPVDATFTHLVEPGAEPIAWTGIALIAGGLAAAALLWRRGRPEARPLAAALGVYALLLTPGAMGAVTFLQQPGRYAWLPTALALPLLAAAAPRLSRPWLAPLAVGAWCLAWLPVTLTRVQAYGSDRALYLTELQAEPDNPFPQREVGRALTTGGDPETGLPLWEAALAHPPASPFVFDLQQDRLDLAQAAAAAGRTDLALAQLDAFVAEEEAAGREVHESILQLRARISGSR